MIRYNKTEQIGQLRERLLIETVTESVNSYGERTEVWNTLATVWASVSYNIGPSKEADLAGKQTAVGEVEFTVRSRDDFDEKARVTYRSQVYNIDAITETPDRMYKVLQCTKRK